MVKFVVLFRKPRQVAKFEDRYHNFLALIERMPHIQRRQVVDVLGSPLGESPYHRILEIYFESRDTLNEALLSAPGQEAGGELNQFGPRSFDVFFADVYEEAGGRTEPTPEAEPNMTEPDDDDAST